MGINSQAFCNAQIGVAYLKAAVYELLADAQKNGRLLGNSDIARALGIYGGLKTEKSESSHRAQCCRQILEWLKDQGVAEQVGGARTKWRLVESKPR